MGRLACIVLALCAAAAQARVHPTREQAEARPVTELRSFDMWALVGSEARASRQLASARCRPALATQHPCFFRPARARR